MRSVNSSRLGIKNYWPTQYHFLYNGGTRPDPAQAIINATKPWYSGTLGDFMKPGIGGYGSNADMDKTAWASPRILGQKHYELTDHLGNVQAITLDRLTPKRATATTIGTWRADIAAAWDYYPFGMYMPGRNVSDTTAQCITVTQPGWVSVKVPKWVEWAEPWTGRTLRDIRIGPWRVAGGFDDPGGEYSYLEAYEGEELLNATAGGPGIGAERLVELEDGPDAEYEVEARIDNREAGAELLFEVVTYRDEEGRELDKVLASVAVARSGEYKLQFNGSGYEQVYVRVVTREMERGGVARIKLGPVTLWGTQLVPGEVLATVCNGKDAYRSVLNRHGTT